MFTQTDTAFLVVTQRAQDIIYLGRRHHWRFRLIPDFQGVIDRPVYNSKGDWLYMPMRDLDTAIIPRAALKRHEVVEKAGFRVAQVVIGHEIKIRPEEIQETLVQPKPTPEINWGNVAEVAGKGILVGMAGIAMVSLYALTGALQLVDPSYCIVLAGDDEPGTVIELMRWNVEA